MLGLAVQLRAQGVDVRMCAPPDFAEHVARIGVPMIAAGKSVRDLVHGVKASGTKPSTPADAPRVAAALVATQFETVAPAAEGCDALVATGLMPAGVRSIAESLGISLRVRGVHAGCAAVAASDATVAAGLSLPAGRDNTDMWEVDAERVQALYGAPLNAHRAALGLPPVDNVRDHVHTDRPWLAADPTLGPWPGSPDLDVVQTGAWILPDTRPLPAELDGVPGGRRAAGVRGLQQRPRPGGRRRVADRGDPRAGAPCAHRAAAGPTWPRSTIRTTASSSERSTSRRCSPGWRPSYTTAARERRRQRPAQAAPQVVVPQIADQPYWAGRVAALGIGVAHDGANPTSESLSVALETALAPDSERAGG